MVDRECEPMAQIYRRSPIMVTQANETVPMERQRHAVPVLSGAYLCRGEACLAQVVKISR